MSQNRPSRTHMDFKALKILRLGGFSPTHPEGKEPSTTPLAPKERGRRGLCHVVDAQGFLAGTVVAGWEVSDDP